jgi:hypothetical protein
MNIKIVLMEGEEQCKKSKDSDIQKTEEAEEGRNTAYESAGNKNSSGTEGYS